jgi:2-methylcitrate dehydratase PrpD
MAALLAEQGYSGSRDMLDNPYGFHVFYGASAWLPEKFTDGLGETWKFMATMYKIYPCCRFLQSALDCLIDLIDRYHFKPDEIESIKAYSLKFTAHPDQYFVKTQIDAQYSFPYAAAALVFGIRPGVDWQNMNTIKDPEIQQFMRKIEFIPTPRAGEEKAKDPRSWYAKVDIMSKGATFSQETMYSKGTNMEGYALTDEVLLGKFRHNSARRLTQAKIQNAIACIFDLENVKGISELMGYITI